MSWKAFKVDLHKALHEVEHLATEAGKGIEHEAARLGEDVASARPLQLVLPKLADTVDEFLASHAGYDFPKSVSVSQPSAHPVLKAGTPTSVVPPKGFQLTASQPEGSFGLHLSQAGDARLDLTAFGPGTDWAKKGDESAVMSVYVDGKYQQDVVLWGGAKSTDYALSLGKLPAGDHTVTLRYAKNKSTRGATGVNVTAGTAAVEKYATPEDKWAAENAPILLGRHGGIENNHTDTPLGMYHSISKHADGTTTISYGYVYSNEDTGDGGAPALEQARWGRLTDLETVFEVKLDSDGKVLSRTYEGAGHHWHPFQGKLDGTHPIIRTATDNNNVTDQGDGVLRFQLPTDHRVGNFPREDVMRQNPQWFEAEGKELHREGKIDPKGIGSPPVDDATAVVKSVLADLGLGQKATMADPRNYLYVQLDASGARKDPVVARVTMKDGRTVDSDLGVPDAAIARDGWSQTTVRLPPGTTAADIASVRFVSANGASDGSADVRRVGHVYTLDQDYQPRELPSSLIQAA